MLIENESKSATEISEKLACIGSLVPRTVRDGIPDSVDMIL
jgi:hypothetical protein